MKERPGEFEIIAECFAPLAGEGSFEFKDDAARFVPPEDMELVITSDAICEGVHFLEGTPAGLVAQKGLRTNLSDLAAKGAQPVSISLTLGLGANWELQWIRDFAAGLSSDLQKFGVTLLGGDTFNSPGGVVVSISAIGQVQKGNYVSRLGAKPGDLVYATGTIGDAGLGLAVEQGWLETNDKDARFLSDRYLLPRPRLEACDVLREFASASMDISDGLVGDFEKLCWASGVSGKLEASCVPLSDAARSVLASRDSNGENRVGLGTLLTAGDDYELLMTVSPGLRIAFERSSAELPFSVTRIGEISTGQGVFVFDADGSEMEFKNRSYSHF